MDTSVSVRKAANVRRRVRGRRVASVLLIGVVGLALLPGCDGGSRSAARRGAAESPGHATDRFTVDGTGDFLLHGTVTDQAAADARAKGQDGYDFVPMLAQLKPFISRADLGICHVETPLASQGGPISGYPGFNSPPQIVDAVRWLGYDTCSTASNHALDQGEPGVRRTLGKLDDAGVRHAGTARDADEAKRLTILDVKGVKVAHLSYAYGLNSDSKPAGKPWLVNDELDPGTILADAARAKKAGAEVVILSLHWGTEYEHEATPEQRRLAATLLRSSDVDLILGCHAHVVQPFEQINGKWVAYGMGNQVANPTANSQATHEGLVAQFTFTRDAQKRWRAQPSFIPTLVARGRTIRLRTLGSTLVANQATVNRTTQVVRSLGYNVPIGPGEEPVTQ